MYIKKGKQAAIQQALQMRKDMRARRKIVAPGSRGQGPDHRHTVAGITSNSVQPPKEGGSEVADRGQKSILTLEQGLTVVQEGTIGEIGRDRERSAGEANEQTGGQKGAVQGIDGREGKWTKGGKKKECP